MSQRALVIRARLWCWRSQSQEVSKAVFHTAIIHAVPISRHCCSKVWSGFFLRDLLVEWERGRKNYRVFPTHVYMYTHTQKCSAASSSAHFVLPNHPWHQGTAAAKICPGPLRHWFSSWYFPQEQSVFMAELLPWLSDEYKIKWNH